MKTIDLMPVQVRPRFNLKQAPHDLPINHAIQIKAAELWLRLGEADGALRELEKLSETWNHPYAVRVWVAALGMLERGEVAL
jgi:hypothetical protein